jgi:hypothetical protein
MKQCLIIWLGLMMSFALKGQLKEAVTHFLSSQEKFGSEQRFSGQVRSQKQNGEAIVGKFCLEGDKYQIVWNDGEIRCDGQFEWEILHRSKRIKKRHYDPTLIPAVAAAFRLYRLDLESEVVQINGGSDRIALDIEFGTSVAQGSHYLKIAARSLEIESIVLHANQDGYFEKAEIADLKAGDLAGKGTFDLDQAEWKKKGYSVLDLAKGASDVVWPVEKALR